MIPMHLCCRCREARLCVHLLELHRPGAGLPAVHRGEPVPPEARRLLHLGGFLHTLGSNSTVYIHGKYPQNPQHHSPTVLSCSSQPFVSVCMGMSLSASAPVLFFPAFYFPHVELSDWPPCVFTSSLGAV
ncbi:hypothetical protein CDAR_368041 [Caerostris darwini]|uniref:Uncharacterized protein n=1 Tax=Caerostris darwini TaxID=1538125 RepID=A0AAV4UI84_9ARAC|nr:hypothetical protein CDAR_368041 [Caerostris darwini]